jgi:hypothetical protein
MSKLAETIVMGWTMTNGCVLEWVIVLLYSSFTLIIHLVTRRYKR